MPLTRKEMFYLSANPNKIKTFETKPSPFKGFYLSANPNKIKTDKSGKEKTYEFYLSANPNKIKTVQYLLV